VTVRTTLELRAPVIPLSGERPGERTFAQARVVAAGSVRSADGCGVAGVAEPSF
jgi:hypothetical protein